MESVGISTLTTAEKWGYIYQFFGIKEFMAMASSPELQAMLFPLKFVFILFTLALLFLVLYLYMNSSYLRYQFLQDVTEFFSWQAYGLKEINKRWKNITKNLGDENEEEHKLAIIEADDLMYQIMEEKGYEGETFEQLLEKVGRKIIPNHEELLFAHQMRNSIVYDANYQLDIKIAKKAISDYETAIKNLAIA